MTALQSGTATPNVSSMINSPPLYLILFVVAVFVGVFVLVFILNARIKNLNSKKTGKTKIPYSYGKIVMWVMIVAVIVALGLIAPKYIKKSWKEKTVSKLSIPATTIWTKKPNQYGRNPKKRTSGYIIAKVTEDSETKFCFTVFTDKGNSYYYGRRKSKEGKIEGSWRNPPDGGKWYLEKDKSNPNLYKGGINDPYLLDWADFELEILN